MARFRFPRARSAALCGLCLFFCIAAPVAHASVSSVYREVDAAADAYLHYSLGRLMELRGMLNDALVQYRRAEVTDPGSCGIQIAIARVLFTLGRLEDARPSAAAAFHECSESLEATSLFAGIALAEGNAALAESLLVAPASEEGAPVEIVALLAQAITAQGRPEEAEVLLRARTRTDSLSHRLAYLHANLLVELDRREEAAETLLRALALDGDNAAVVQMATGILIELGRTSEAIDVLESFLSGPRSSARHSIALARAYGQIENDARALEVAREGIERFGELPGLIRTLGSILFDIGEVDEALTAYESLLELDAEDVQALNFLAYTLADLELDAPRAVELAEKAVSLSPESGIVRDTLGWAYFRSGRFEEAVRELETAVELGETDPVILEHLGDALDALGRTEEAVDAYERALAEDPTRESAERKIAAARAAAGGASSEEETN